MCWLLRVQIYSWFTAFKQKALGFVFICLFTDSQPSPRCLLVVSSLFHHPRHVARLWSRLLVSLEEKRHIITSKLGPPSIEYKNPSAFYPHPRQRPLPKAGLRVQVTTNRAQMTQDECSGWTRNKSSLPKWLRCGYCRCTLNVRILSDSCHQRVSAKESRLDFEKYLIADFSPLEKSH